MSEQEIVRVYGKKKTETEKAVLVEIDGEDYWLPKSQIKGSVTQANDDYECEIPLWLAEKKGLA